MEQTIAKYIKIMNEVLSEDDFCVILIYFHEQESIMHVFKDKDTAGEYLSSLDPDSNICCCTNFIYPYVPSNLYYNVFPIKLKFESSEEADKTYQFMGEAFLG